MDSIYQTKAEALITKQEILRDTLTGSKGIATTTSSPTTWVSGDPYLYEKWDIDTAGTYTNFKDSNNTAITVSQVDLDANFVWIAVTNGVAKKITLSKPTSTNNDFDLLSCTNLYDGDGTDFAINKYLGYWGTLEDGVGYSVSPLIKIEGYTKIMILKGAGSLGSMFYKSETEVIEGSNSNDSIRSIPDNARFLRVVIDNVYQGSAKFGVYSNEKYKGKPLIYGETVPVFPIEKIADGQIPAEKTDILYGNLANPNDFIYGKYVNSNYGILNDNPAYTATGYISVVPGKKYVKSNNIFYAVYDQNKNFLRGSANGNEIIIGANEYFVNISMENSEVANFMFLEGTTLPSEFLPYNEKFVNPKFLKAELLNPPTQPRLALPRKIHLLKNQENSLYHKAYLERFNPFKFIVAGSGTGWNYRQRYFRANTSIYGDLNIRLLSYESMTEVDNKTISVVSSSKTFDNGNKKIAVIGDSFTQDGYWFSYANSLIPNITFIGTRTSTNAGVLKAEGRGGWTLADYFTCIKGRNGYAGGFSPFMQPNSAHKYYGVVEFWRDVKAGSTSPTMLGFSATNFNSNGYLNTPSIDDVMFSENNNRFETWNGSAWVEISESSLTFTFNYGKYLSVWGLQTPDIVAIALGMNDFGSQKITDTNFLIWKNRIDEVIASVKSANVNSKLVLCTHTVEFAPENNTENENPAIKTANLWEARRMVLEAFDNDTYVNGGLGICDMGSALDGQYGFANTHIKPFDNYAENDLELEASNTPHPNNGGYSQLGVRFAAWVQANR